MDEALQRVMTEWDRLRSLANEQAETPSPISSPLPPEPAQPVPELSEKEIAKRHAMKYAYVEGDLAELYIEDRPQGAPPKGGTVAEAEAKKLAEEKRIQVLAALKLDGKKKKYKKQQEGKLRTSSLSCSRAGR